MVVIKELLEFLEKENIPFEFKGDMQDVVDGFSSLSQYRAGTMTWCKQLENLPDNLQKKYHLIVIPSYCSGISDNYIITDFGKKAFFSLIEAFFSSEIELPDVGMGTYISDRVKIGKNVKIGHNCAIDGDIELGDNTIIYNNVSIINKVIIGKDCVIQSGALIGQDDFSYTENEDHKKNMIKHYGGVQIEDDVLIGPGTIINRGTIDNTIISKGCKIDARCVVSHNVVLGENSVLIAGSILYGSVKTGMNAYVASAMVRNQLRIGDNAVIGMGSVVVKDVDADVTVTGVPAKKFVK
mgnify:CR=1 FL=1